MGYYDQVTITHFKQDSKDKTLETTLDNEGNVYSVRYTSSIKNDEDEKVVLEDKVLIRNYYSTHNQLLGYDDELIGEEVEHKYDSKGNLTETIKNNASFNTHITTSNEDNTSTTNITIGKYDEGVLSSLADLNYTYTYDDTIDKNLESITLPNGAVQNIKLDKLGRTKEIINGNFTKQYSYLTKGNHTSNLVSAEWFGKNNVIRENLHYTYDEKGNITEVRENGVLVNRYTYDSLSRLIREDNKNLNKTNTSRHTRGLVCLLLVRGR
jgi:YD repeat-containing protein